MFTKLFRYFLFFLCFVCCAATFKTFCAIPHRQAKGLFTAVNPAKWYLSPLQGFTWYKRIVRNMYEFGHDDHATIKLVRDLFYIQNENFDISRGPVNPASYLEVADIGKILNAIETVQNDKLQEELIVIISKAALKAPQKIADKKIKDLAKHIIGALQECPAGNTGMYLEYTTHNILLAFLWQKVSDKKLYFEYFAQFDPKLNVLADTSKITIDSYTADEIDAFNAAVNVDPKKLLENYELAVVLGCDGLVRTGDCPPNLGFSKAVFSENGKTSEPFSDCGETAIWNLFNWLLYNKEQGTLDVSLLNHIPTLDKKCIEFFQQYSSVQKLDDIKTRYAWAAVVSGRDNVVYRNAAPRCNISGEKGLSNALAVLNHLLFGNSKDFAAKTKQEQLNYVCEKLSENGLKVAWEVKDGKLEDVNTKDHLTLLLTMIKNNITLKAEWIFLINHFVFSFSGNEDPYGNLGAFLLINYNDQEALDLNALQLFPWYVQLTGHNEIGRQYVQRIKKDKLKVASAVSHFGLFMTPLFTTENKKRVIQFYFNKLRQELIYFGKHHHLKFNEDKNLKSTMVKLIKSLPIDNYTYEQVAKCLIQFNEYDDIELINSIICDPQTNNSLSVKVMERIAEQYRQIRSDEDKAAFYKIWENVIANLCKNTHNDDCIPYIIDELSLSFDPEKVSPVVGFVKLLINRLQTEKNKVKALNTFFRFAVREKWPIQYGEDNLILLLDSIISDKNLAEIRFYGMSGKRSKKFQERLRDRLQSVINVDDKVTIIESILEQHAPDYFDIAYVLVHTLDDKYATGILKGVIIAKSKNDIQQKEELQDWEVLLKKIKDEQVSKIMGWAESRLLKLNDHLRSTLVDDLISFSKQLQRVNQKKFVPDLLKNSFKVLTTFKDSEQKKQAAQKFNVIIHEMYPEYGKLELPIRNELLQQLEQA